MPTCRECGEWCRNLHTWLPRWNCWSDDLGIGADDPRVVRADNAKDAAERCVHQAREWVNEGAETGDYEVYEVGVRRADDTGETTTWIVSVEVVLECSARLKVKEDPDV